GGFIAASRGVDEYTAALGSIVDAEGIRALAQQTTGEAPRDFGDAWNVARAIVDKAAKSAEGLNAEQVALKRTLDTLNPYLSDEAARAGLLAGQLRLAAAEAKSLGA